MMAHIRKGVIGGKQMVDNKANVLPSNLTYVVGFSSWSCAVDG